MYPRPLYLALALLLVLAACKKDPTPELPVDPLSLLPPETQTGRRTFGCLLNGQAWTPAGSQLAGPVLSCSYMNSRLAIVASRVLVVNGANSFQRISLVLDKINQQGTYALNDSTQRFAHYENADIGCDLISSPRQTGSIQLTKLDLVNRIASGRFTFTLNKAGCGRVEVSNGRFDCPF